MALENYRITEFQEKTQVDNGDYVLIDSATDGTHKYQLSRIPAQASAEVDAAVAAEETAREAADAAEVTARNAAIGAAISEEVTARNAAIAANVDNTLTVSGKAADAKKTGDEIADVKSDLEQISVDTGLICDITENPGYITGTGTIGAQGATTKEVYTNLIPVKAGDIIGISTKHAASHSMWVVYATYNSSETYITRSVLTTDTGSSYNGAVTIDGNNVAYVAFSWRTYEDSNAIIYKDNSQTALNKCKQIGSPMSGYIPSGANYPAIDTVAKTLYLQSGSVIIDKRLPNGYTSISANITYDYSALTTTAIIFTWDIDNATVKAFAYNASIDLTKFIPFCLLRTNRKLISSSIPMTVDGLLFGVVSFDKINQGSVWSNDNVKGINHRGYTVVAPENTLPAFKLSKDVGFKYVETDVRFTQDGIAVLLHDQTINRTSRNADGTTISETINIDSIDYEDVLEYDFGIYKSSAYAGTKIPTFTQFLKACRKLGLQAYIELKVGTQAQIESLVDMTVQCGMKGKCTWISYNETLLTYVKNYADTERIGLVADSYSSTVLTTIDSLKTANNEVFLDLTTVSQVTDSAVTALIADNVPLECLINGNYTIASANPYITGITTDSGNISQYLYELWDRYL